MCLVEAILRPNASAEIREYDKYTAIGDTPWFVPAEALTEWPRPAAHVLQYNFVVC